jgi:hypothetical protein
MGSPHRVSAVDLPMADAAGQGNQIRNATRASGRNHETAQAMEAALSDPRTCTARVEGQTAKPGLDSLSPTVLWRLCRKPSSAELKKLGLFNGRFFSLPMQ